MVDSHNFGHNDKIFGVSVTIIIVTSITIVTKFFPWYQRIWQIGHKDHNLKPWTQCIYIIKQFTQHNNQNLLVYSLLGFEDSVASYVATSEFLTPYTFSSSVWGPHWALLLLLILACKSIEKQLFLTTFSHCY